MRKDIYFLLIKTLFQTFAMYSTVPRSQMISWVMAMSKNRGEPFRRELG